MNKNDYFKIRREIKRQHTIAKGIAMENKKFYNAAKGNMSLVAIYHLGRKEALESLSDFMGSNWHYPTEKPEEILCTYKEEGA